MTFNPLQNMPITFSPRTISSSSIGKAVEHEEPASPSPCPCTPKILLHNNEITNENCNLQVGDKVILKIVCGECTLTDIQWEIPGVIFKNYSASRSSAVLTPVPPGEKNESEITFYWADAADARKIKCKFKAEKDSAKGNCTAEATLNVKKPSVSFTAVLGTYAMRLYAGQIQIILQPDATHTQGIEFSGDVLVPSGFDFPLGEWHVVQRLTLNEVRRCYSTLICEEPRQNKRTILDTDYPYAPGPANTAPPAAWTAAETTNPQEWADSPSVSLGVSFEDYNPQFFRLAYTDAQYREDFETYIMYKPGSQDSKWVPLQRINWWTDACLYHVPGPGLAAWNYGAGFTDPANRAYATEAFEETVHPEWTEYYNTKGHTWLSTDCPAFCRP
jgi:hypothetical protein